MTDQTQDNSYKGKYEQISQEPDFPVTCHLAEKVEKTFIRTPAHWHEHIELLYVIRGELPVFVQGRLITATPGDLIAINSGELHAIPLKPQETVYECLIVHKRLCTRISLPVDTRIIKNQIRDEKYAEQFLRITDEFRRKPYLYKINVQLNLLSLLVGLFRDHASEQSAQLSSIRSSKEQTIKKAIEYIHEHYAEDISTDDVCTYLGFDKSYFCNCFRAATGSTLLDYLNVTRCEHARELLLTSQLSVAECASQSGFQHLSYFSKTYKRYIGELPSVTARSR